MSKEFLAQLRALASANERSLSAEVRYALRQHLKSEAARAGAAPQTRKTVRADARA